MAFTFAAFSYIIALIIDAFLIFFAIFHVSNLLSDYQLDFNKMYDAIGLNANIAD